MNEFEINRKAWATRYADDLIERKKGATATVSWNDAAQTATFLGRTYPTMVQQVGPEGERWRSFSTLVRPSLLWTDQEVQPRQADPKRLAELAWHLRTYPLLSPILARWSPAQKKLLVFDGNHRLSAYIIARGDHPIPVTVFDGPDPLQFLAVAVEAHDNLTQLKYQYSDKALKYSALTANELQQAVERWGKAASEELAWTGMRGPDVRMRILGATSRHLQDAGGWRTRWFEAGLSDASWNRFLEEYAKTTAESEVFESPKYLRASERENLGHPLQDHR